MNCASGLPTGHLAVGTLNARTNPDHAGFPPPVHQHDCLLRNSFFECVARGEAVRDLPENCHHCHLLPFSSRKTAKPAATVTLPS